MEIKRYVSARELYSVLENMELRIRILKELMGSIDGAMQFPVREELFGPVEALVMRKTVSSTGCSDPG